ncbi:MAG: 50S ribosomal protein L32 [Candidatus Pacebacteria bacterium]|nr:50S ribosomal protein L32 [Candidatus Paceibacterota bacterium]
MTVRMRHTRGHTANRRSHHALTEGRYSTCPTCKAQHVRHQMCPKCGTYKSRTVIDVKSKLERQLTRRRDKMKAMGEPAAKAEKASSEK